QPALGRVDANTRQIDARWHGNRFGRIRWVRKNRVERKRVSFSVVRIGWQEKRLGPGWRRTGELVEHQRHLLLRPNGRGNNGHEVSGWRRRADADDCGKNDESGGVRLGKNVRRAFWRRGRRSGLRQLYDVDSGPQSRWQRHN